MIRIPSVEKKKAIYLLQLFTVIILLLAFSMEIFFQAIPCELCTIQRVLWLFVIFVSLIFANRWLLSIIVLANFFVSLYQIGLQYNLISSENGICPISDTAVVSCTQLGFVIFNLPLSAYNALACMITIFFIIKFIRK